MTVTQYLLPAILLTGAALGATLAGCAPGRTNPPEMPRAHILMHTTMGDIVIELNQAAAPITCANFLRYADRGFFDGTIIHRVVPGFVIQGGGLTQDMSEKPTDPPIKNEWRNGLSNVRGAVAMARVGGEADSATSQFFINLVDNAMLDEARDGAAYAVFGAVISGMEVVDQIAAVQTETRGEFAGVPVEPIVIESVVRMTDE